ncbi:MAG: PocR ligand-binding domain-containing protein [Desulfuromonadaceae bacterium]
MDQHSIRSQKPVLFVRAPYLQQMRSPLHALWNQDLAVKERKTVPEINLAQLVDFSQLNEVFSSYLEVIGLPVSILDHDGHVLASSNWQRICVEFHRAHEGTLARCLESDTTLSGEMQEGKEYALYRCRNGLTDCATPIIIEGQHIANLFIGQFFLAPPDLKMFDKLCAAYGFDHYSYFQALSEVPIVDEAKIPAIMRMLVGFASQIATQSLAERRAQLAYEDIEKIVIERTQSLAEALAFNGTILFDSPLPMAVYTASGQCVFVNDAFSKLVGASSDVLLAQNVHDLDSWKRSGMLDSFLSVLEYTQLQRGEVHDVTSFGKEVWIEYQMCPARLLGADHLLMQVVEITERKRAEIALTESESCLRAIINNVPECIKIVDEEGSLVSMNPAGLKMIEADSLDQTAGRTVHDLIAPEYRNDYAAMHKQVISGKAMQLKYEIIGVKGGRRMMETHAVPMRFQGRDVHLAVTRNVTEELHDSNKVVEKKHENPACCNFLP